MALKTQKKSNQISNFNHPNNGEASVLDAAVYCHMFYIIFCNRNTKNSNPTTQENQWRHSRGQLIKCYFHFTVFTKYVKLKFKILSKLCLFMFAA